MDEHWRKWKACPGASGVLFGLCGAVGVARGLVSCTLISLRKTSERICSRNRIFLISLTTFASRSVVDSEGIVSVLDLTIYCDV